MFSWLVSVLSIIVLGLLVIALGMFMALRPEAAARPSGSGGDTANPKFLRIMGWVIAAGGVGISLIGIAAVLQR